MSILVPSGYLTFSEALDRVASVLHIEKREAQKTLRQLLYSGQVPSRIIENSGRKYDVPAHVWGGMKWDKALKSDAICFEVAAYAPDAHGRIIIPQSRLIETLKSRIPQETETHQRDTTEAEADSASAGQDRSQGLGRKDQRKGGRAQKYDRGLQQFIDRLSDKFRQSGQHLSLGQLVSWLAENAALKDGYEPQPEIPDFDDVEYDEETLWWKDSQGQTHSLKRRTLEPYLARARSRDPDNPS